MKRTLFLLLCSFIVTLALVSCATGPEEQTVLPPTVQAAAKAPAPESAKTAEPAAEEAVVEEEGVQFPYEEISSGLGDSNFYALCNGNVILSTEDRELAESVYAIPPELDDPKYHGIVIEAFTCEYWFQGSRKTAEYQIICFGIECKDTYADASPENPVPVRADEYQKFRSDSLGYIKGSNAGACIRCKELDENLVSCCVVCPKYYEGWWYYATEFFDEGIPKLLMYQPADGFAETLGALPAADESATFSHEPVRIKTQLSAYPDYRLSTTLTEDSLRKKFFPNVNGWPTNLDAMAEINGTTWNVMYPHDWITYFLDEYDLGSDIYLYAELCYAFNGEIWLYGCDFQTYDPEVDVEAKSAYITYANFGDNSLR